MLPILELRGSAYERGRQHGLQGRARVERSIANYARLFDACGLGWEVAQRLSQPYRKAIEDFSGDLYEEMRGIADGASCKVQEIVTLNARTEILPPTLLQRPSDAWLAERQATPADFGECSSLAIHPDFSATGGALLAQNWDWLGCQRESLLLLRVHREHDSSFLTLTEAGMLAKIGCNDGGFGVCLNVLRSQDDGARAGVPVHVLLRALLDCDDVAAAVARISGMHFGASSNILCADSGGARAAFELAPAGAEILEGQGPALCHTNHFLARGAAISERAMPAPPSSKPRLDRMQSLVGEVGAAFSVATLQRILSDESAGYFSISRHPDPSVDELARLETVASVVMDLAARIMHVATDIPTRTTYRAVALAAASVAC
jgi:isopenicillin-N N-acyltransferase-like protein